MNDPVFTTSYGTLIGRVKWFRSKLGYGFITVLEKDKSVETDVFIHQSNIKTKHSQYRTLKEGEYVSLNLSVSNDSQQAVDVTGVHGGPLICDNRFTNHNQDQDQDHNPDQDMVVHQ
jgi:cold shock CspA family protein